MNLMDQSDGDERWEDLPMSSNFLIGKEVSVVVMRDGDCENRRVADNSGVMAEILGGWWTKRKEWNWPADGSECAAGIS